MLCFYSIDSPTLEKEIHEARGITKSVAIRKLVTSIARDLYEIITSHEDLEPTYHKDFDMNFDAYIDPIYEVVYNHNDPWIWETSTDDMKALARKHPEIEFVLSTTDIDTNEEWREFFKDDKYAISYCHKVFDAAPTWSNTSFEDTDE